LEAGQELTAQALAINENVLGAEHVATANSLDNLASVLTAQGELNAAKPLFSPRARNQAEKARPGASRYKYN
jgi:hypothetical protein